MGTRRASSAGDSGASTAPTDEQRLQDAARSGMPFAASIAVDRVAGAMLLPDRKGEIPEKLLDQLQDRTLVEDTPIYWMRTFASNGAIDHYGTVMQTDSLRNYAHDSEAGLPFCNCHKTDELPFGRTFDGSFHQARGQNLARTDMDVYVPFDMNVNGVDTTHFVKAVRAGVARDVSIQFDPHHIQCSIDGRNMPMSLLDLLFSDPEDPDGPCRHIPGVTYKVDGKKVRALGKVFGAHCLHLSPVWKGATPGATISPSRALVVDERDGPPQWALFSPALRTAALLAEAEQLDRVTALTLENHMRGVRFPDITTLRFAGWSAAREDDDEDTPLDEGDEGDPLADGAVPGAQPQPPHTEKQEPPMPDPTEAASGAPPDATSGPTAGGQSAAISANPAAAPPASAGGDDAPPPPVTRAAAAAAPTTEAGDPPPATPIWHGDVRRALISSGLAQEGFDGDPIAQLTEAGRQLTLERAWGAWGRRYRTELAKEVDAEGVRCFGAEAWPTARVAYVPTIERGTADELVALRDHLRAEAAKRLRGGRISRDDATDGTPNGQPKPNNGRPRVPAAAYRS